MERSYLDASFLFNEHFNRLVIFLREGYRQTGKDWRGKWRQAALWLLAIIWIICLLVSFGILAALPASEVYNTESACQPDGSFTLDPSAYRYWSKSGFFQITLGFGNLTFTQAKAIDIIWDVVFGRGGQGLLALISWRVFANYVTTSMEVMPVTFGTYRTVFLQNESLLVGIPRMVRDFTRRHRLHSKIAMVFMIMTMAFVLAFPTFGSAMTGYSGNVGAYVADTDSQLIPFQDFRFALYVIHDGWRIGIEGLEGEYIVSSPSDVAPVLGNGLRDWNGEGLCYYYPDSNEACQVVRNVTDYVKQYGFSSSINESSTILNKTIPGPALNISSFYLPYDLRDNSDDAANYSRITWAHSNSTYSADYIREHGSCQPLLDYRWGFSYVQLFFMVVFLIIWSVGIYILWLRSHIIMKRRGRQAVAGEVKAVFELADAMQMQLEEHGIEEGFKISTLSESRLRRRITKDLRGGTISYKTSLLENGKNGEGDSGWGFKVWLKKEKWWLTGLLVSILVLLAAALTSPIRTSMVTYGLPLEVLISMYIGSTDRSRLIIFLWSFITLSVVPQIIFSILVRDMDT
ncbi:Nn.00g108590.m01.CDS01 [Neocucurbitaria sp. VM-36]